MTPKRMRARSRWFVVAAAAVVVAAFLVLIVWRSSSATSEARPLARIADSRADAGQQLVAPTSIASESDRSLPQTPEPLEGEGAAASKLRLVVLESDGAPAASARLALLDPSGGVMPGMADASGVLELDPREGRGTLFVRRIAGWPYREELALAAGEHVVHLPREAEISGVVREHGAFPSRVLNLRLLSDIQSRELDVPAQVDEALELGDQVLRGLTCATNARGEFVFQGLPAKWSGSIQVPQAFVLAQRGRDGKVTRSYPLAPRRNLVLDVELLPFVRARVVEPDGLTPVGLAPVGWFVSWSDGASSTSGVETDLDGRFEVPLRDAQFARIHFQFAGPGGRNPTELDFVRDQVGDPLDLGDLRLSTGRTIAFRVLDIDGAPIAHATVGEDAADQHAESDERGCGVLIGVPDRVTQLFARATGYWMAYRDVAPASSEPITFELARGNRLEIDVRTPSSASAQGVIVELSATKLVIPDGGGPSDRWFGTPEAGMHERFTDRQLPLDLRNLAPDVPFELTVRDAVWTLLRQETIGALGPTEERRHVVQLEQESRCIRGRAQGPDGEPVTEALGTVSRPGQPGTSFRTDGKGEFRVCGIFTERVELVLGRPGYLHTTFADVLVPEGGAELLLTLERGREVEVEVRDVEGRPVGSGQLTVASDRGSRYYAKKIVDGRYRFIDLPAPPFVIELALAGKHYELEHVRDGSESFVVPLHGSLKVECRVSSEPEDASWNVQLVCTSAELEPVTQFVSTTRTTIVTFAAVLPGEYEVSLRRGRIFTSDTPVLAHAHVVVAANETASATLTP